MSIRTRLISVLAVALVAAGAACGGVTDNNETTAPALKDQTLQGSIDGNDWEFTAGTAAVAEGEMSLQLYAGPDDACEFDEASHDGWSIITSVAEEETRHELSIDLTTGGGQSVTFSKASSNVVVGTGFIEITSISDTTIEGDLVAKSDDDNVVNGSFEATRCANQESGS